MATAALAGVLVFRARRAHAGENITGPRRPDGISLSAGHILRTAGHILLVAATICVPSYRVHQINEQNRRPLPPVPINATVLDTRMLSYSQELTLAINAPGEKSGRARQVIIAYIPNRLPISAGDGIEILSPPVEITDEDHGRSRFNEMLLRKGIRHIIRLNERNYRIVRRAPPSARSSLRNLIGMRIQRLYNEDTAALLTGLYFGNQNYIRKATIESFRRAGVLHILAASGSHLAIIAMIPFFIFGAFKIDRRFTLSVTLVAVTLYLYLTDTPVSLQRATIMCGIFFIQFMFDFDRNPFNALFIAAIAVLIFHPYELYGLGFQLTFGATLGIIAFFRAYSGTFSFLPKFIAKPVAFTLSAQALVYPILFFQMGEINLTALISNLVIVPVIDCILVASIGVTAFSALVPFDVRAAAHCLDIGYGLTRGAVDFMAGLGLHFPEAAFSWIIPASYLCYLAPLLPMQKQRQLLSLPVLFAFAAVWWQLAGPPGHHERFAVLNTPDSQALIVRRKNGPVFFGAIGSREDAERVVRYLNRRNISGLTVYLTRTDYGSIRHASHILKSCVVRECLLPEGFQYGRYLERLLEIIEEDRITLSFYPAPPPRPLTDTSRGTIAHPDMLLGPAELHSLHRHLSESTPGQSRSPDVITL